MATNAIKAELQQRSRTVRITTGGIASFSEALSINGDASAQQTVAVNGDITRGDGNTSELYSTRPGIIDGNTNVILYLSRPLLKNSSNLNEIAHFKADPNEGSTNSGDITNHYGFFATSNVGNVGTTNYGFYSAAPSGPGENYNFFAAGEAPNYFAGPVTGGNTDAAPNWTINADGTSNIKTSETLTVKDFGAKGDGTDIPEVEGGVGAETSAINAALDWWAAAPYRHLHFPEGTYLYNGSHTIDFVEQERKYDDNGVLIQPEIRRYGNKLTMDGEIKATLTSGTVFNFKRMSDGLVQMFVHKGGEAGTDIVTGNYDLSNHGPNGVTFLRMEAAHYTKINLHTIAYRGRTLHMTDYYVNAGDEHYAGNHCVFCDVHLVGKGRVEGRVGQQFFWDTGRCTNRGASGSMTWEGDGYWYGSVFEKVGDLRCPVLEAGSFFKLGLDFRGCFGVHMGIAYIGETVDATIPLGSVVPDGRGRRYQDAMIGDADPVADQVLLNIRNSFDGVLSTDFYIDKYIALEGGVGLNVEGLYQNATGVHINQMRVAGCSVGVNLNRVYGDVYIGALTCDSCGMLINKFGVDDNHDLHNLIDINVVKLGKCRYNGKNRKLSQETDENGNPVFDENGHPVYKDGNDWANYELIRKSDADTGGDEILPPIRSQWHHGTFKLTGNFEDSRRDAFNQEGKLPSGQFIIHIIDDGVNPPNINDYYLINGATINAGAGSAIEIANFTNRVRVTDCIIKTDNNTPFTGSSTPSYVRGCVGAADTP